MRLPPPAARLALALGLGACLGGARATRADETLYIEAGTVIPVEGDPVPGGRIVVRDGKVVEVGKDVVRPPFSREVDAHDLTVTPGFVVPLSRLSLPDTADAPPPGGPTRIAMDASVRGDAELTPLDGDLRFALQSGITTLGLAPPMTDAGLDGQVSAVTTRPGPAKDMSVAGEAAVILTTSSGTAWRTSVGHAFRDAVKAAVDELHHAHGKASAPGEGGDKAKDPLGRIVRRQEPAWLYPGTTAGWVAALDELPLARLDLTVVDSYDLWRVADALKAKAARVLTWPALVRAPRTRFPVNRAAVYERAGLPFAFLLPEDSARGCARLRDAAILMQRSGCSRGAVLRALTLEGAKALGVDKTLGSIQAGRRADLDFWSGDPLDPTSRLVHVMVAGEQLEPRRQVARPGDAVTEAP